MATISAWAVGSLVAVTQFAALGDDFAILHYDRAEWPALLRAHVRDCKLNRSGHEGVAHGASI